MATPNVSSFSTLRARSYVFRLPLFTRAIILVIVVFWILSLQSAWDVKEWGALIPDKTGITTLYRTNTFPLIHVNLFHTIMNILALTPLLERFESEYGTLTSLALFIGPLTTLPAFLYLFFEKYILHGNTAVMGSSIWFFLLLGMEAIRTYRANPHFELGPYRIPTWTTPLALVLFVAALVPSTSLLGHLCGLGVGYLCGLGYMKFLSPPEKALRWIESKLRLLQRLPHYVSVDQKTYGRFGVLPTAGSSSGAPIGLVSTTQRLGP